MSWLFAISNSDVASRKPVSKPDKTPLFTISTPTLSLAVGGNPDTCFWGSDEATSTGWAVLGIGIISRDYRSTILTRDDWHRLLTQDSFEPGSLDGHFVAVRWKPDQLECFVDQLGLRTLYFSNYDKGICVSTRLDWVAHARDSAEINFDSLGGRWLLFNQLSHESGIVGVERLGPGGWVRISRGCVINFRPSHPWLPSCEPVSPEIPAQILNGLVNCASEYPGGLSLGLSGGLDSRVLIALLTASEGRSFATHTFGESRDPDVQVATRIAVNLGTSNHRFDDDIPDTQACIREVNSFASQMDLTEPCTSYLKLRYYSRLHSLCGLMMDGGFGEIARRQYFNRLVRLGRSALKTRDIGHVFRLMSSHRSDIFSNEVKMLLETGARKSVERILEEMPNVEKIGTGNFADLLAARSRLPGYGAPAQARLDTEILNFMPLIQPSFLRSVFGMPVRLRENGRFYNNLIRIRVPALARFPLVKGGFTHRFGLSTNMVWLTTNIKSKFKSPYADSGPHVLLQRLQSYVLDLAHSGSVANNSIYDAHRVAETVSKYYQGELRLAREVAWWLTFELWRQSLTRDKVASDL
jgi:hypothetical protein